MAAGQSLANWVIPSLPPTLLQGLPARMNVADVTAAVNSVTHPSRFGHPAHPNALAPAAPESDYEKLEHLGDNVVGSAVTMIIHKLYPWLKPGPCTVLRGQVCSNQVLSQISVHLGLPIQLRANPAQTAHLRQNPSIQAAMFEAHIGALAISNLESIVFKPIISSYLESIFDPIIRWAFEALRTYQDGLVGGIGTEEIDRVAIGAKHGLDQYFQIPGRGTCEFVFEKTFHGPPFSVDCHVELRSGRMLMTSAVRGQKKLAIAAASWEMCGELGLPRSELEEDGPRVKRVRSIS